MAQRPSPKPKLPKLPNPPKLSKPQLPSGSNLQKFPENPSQNFPPYDRSIPSGEMPLSPLMRQTYNDMLARGMLQQQAILETAAQAGGIRLNPPPLPTSDQLNSMIDPNRKYAQETGTMYDQFGRPMNYSNSGQKDALKKLGFISQSNFDFIKRENPNLSAESALKNYNIEQLQSMGRSPEQANQELGQMTSSMKYLQQQPAIGGFIPTPVQSIPAAQPSTQPTTPTIPVPQTKQNQQAMQNPGPIPIPRTPLPLPIPPVGQRGPADEPLTRGDIVLNPNLIKRARDEYSASLPQNARYFDVMTPTKYGGMFGSSAGSGFDAWFEKNYINNPNSPLNDQERLVLQRQIPITQANTQQFQPGYQEAMGQQTYYNLMQQQMANAAAQGSAFTPIQQQQPVRSAAQQNQQAMQNYTNLLNQGLANYRAQTGQPTFGQPKQQTPRNISTPGFPTPKPFG